MRCWACPGAKRMRRRPRLLLLRPSGGQPFALGVDLVHDHEELVIKPAAPAVMATGLYAGTTLPDGGRPMLLLDPAGIAAVTGISLEAGAPPRPPGEAVEKRCRPCSSAISTGRGAACASPWWSGSRTCPAPPCVWPAARVRLAHKGRIMPVLGHDVPADGRPCAC